MNEKNAQLKEKERAAKIKALREDLEAQLEEQLPVEMLEERQKGDIPKPDNELGKDPAYAKQIVEAMLFAATKPLTAAEIRKALQGSTPKQIEKWSAELKETYEREGRSFELLEIAGGWEISTKKEFAPWILKIELQKKARQASQSALETLAILAYKQPISRVEIEELRGVDVSGVLNTLMERGLIKIVGKKEIPGRPFLYGTTEKFLEHFGLKSMADLPNIEEIKNVVESAVKKDELMGTTKMVDVPQEGQPQEGAEDQTRAEEAKNEEATIPTETEDTLENRDGSERTTQEN